MTLTLDDLQLLRRLRLLIESGDVPATMREVATRLGIQRTLLYRLRDRVNEQLEGEFEWIQDGRLVLPAEIFRLTRLMLSDDGELSGTGFPVISAGSAACTLLTEYILRRGLSAPRLKFQRSADAAKALLTRDIDMALLHRIDGGEESMPTAHSQHCTDELSEVTVRKWQAVEVRPLSETPQPRRVRWEAVSFAWRLEQLTRSAAADELSAATPDSPSVPIRLSGYAASLEMLRRQLPIATTVPSIYLAAYDRQLFQILPTQVPVTGSLVAMFRRNDQQRFADWLDQDIWQQCGLPAEQ